MPIKYILLAIILLIIIRVTSKLRSRELGIREYLLWVIFWLGAGLVIIYPETANFVANLVGVGRGADVMVYTSIIAIFYFVFRIFYFVFILSYFVFFFRSSRPLSLSQNRRCKNKKWGCGNIFQFPRRFDARTSSRIRGWFLRPLSTEKSPEPSASNHDRV